MGLVEKPVWPGPWYREPTCVCQRRIWAEEQRRALAKRREAAFAERSKRRE
jgi:hypothetical protein